MGKKKEESLTDLWDYHNICITGIQKERWKSGAEKVLKDITAENLPNLERKTKSQIQEAEQTPHRIYLKKSMPRHIVNFWKPKAKKIS